MFAPVMLFAAFALTASADGIATQASNDRPTAPAPSRISYDGIGNGWTGGRTRWWIDRSGRGGYETTEAGQAVSGRFNAGPQGFRQIRDLLAPLSGLGAVPCRIEASDQPVGQLSWRSRAAIATLRLDFGCADNPPHEAFARFDRAAGLVRSWATTPRPAA